MAGKLILTKSTLDSLPIYWFSFLKMPIGVRKKIDSIRNGFLWGAKKMHLTSWKDVTLNKRHGGLGITNLEHRNIAMLGKVWWRILENKNTALWMKLLKDKYGEDVTSWTLGNVRNNSSTLIKNLRHLKEHSITSTLFDTCNLKWKANRGDIVKGYLRYNNYFGICKIRIKL